MSRVEDLELWFLSFYLDLDYLYPTPKQKSSSVQSLLLRNEG